MADKSPEAAQALVGIIRSVDELKRNYFDLESCSCAVYYCACLRQFLSDYEKALDIAEAVKLKLDYAISQAPIGS